MTLNKVRKRPANRGDYDVSNGADQADCESLIDLRRLTESQGPTVNQVLSEACTASESEDWQIVDVDSDQMGSNNNNNNNNNHIASCTPDPTKTQIRSEPGKMTKNYRDIDPLKLQEGTLSSPLIRFCTATYSLLPLASTLAALALIGLLFTRFFYLPLLYLALVYWDRQTCNRGGRRIESVYRSKYWSYLAANFPIKLRHSDEFKLDPSRNYILNYHPHGIAAFGAVTAFATDGLNFSKLFPGITPRFMVHETSFVIPLMREVFSFRGDCSVNSKSIDYMLSSKERTGKAGNLLTIVVGGLAEADLSEAEVLKVVIAERKGFVKKALIHGADIIPCIAFGENSVFKKVHLEPNSFWHRLESKWYKLFRFKHPIYYGTSLVSDKLKGMMPYKRPITVVMGDPIRVSKIASPTQEDIDLLHLRYIDDLKTMYKDNWDLCTKYDKKLELV